MHHAHYGEDLALPSVSGRAVEPGVAATASFGRHGLDPEVLRLIQSQQIARSHATLCWKFRRWSATVASTCVTCTWASAFTRSLDPRRLQAMVRRLGASTLAAPRAYLERSIAVRFSISVPVAAGGEPGRVHIETGG